MLSSSGDIRQNSDTLVELVSDSRCCKFMMPTSELFEHFAMDINWLLDFCPCCQQQYHLCQEAEETTLHLLGKCCALINQRLEILGSHYLE